MQTALIAVIVAVVVGAGAIGSAFALDPSIDPWQHPASGSANSTRVAWTGGFAGCCVEIGGHHAFSLAPPEIPPGTYSAFLNGSVTVTSWTQSNGTANVSGPCAAGGGGSAMCQLDVGVFTGAAWDAFQSGAPPSPTWCFSTQTGGCLTTQNVTFSTTAISAIAGQSWWLVLWNNETAGYGLTLSCSFALAVSPNFYTLGGV